MIYEKFFTVEDYIADVVQDLMVYAMEHTNTDCALCDEGITFQYNLAIWVPKRHIYASACVCADCRVLPDAVERVHARWDSVVDQIPAGDRTAVHYVLLNSALVSNYGMPRPTYVVIASKLCGNGFAFTEILQNAGDAELATAIANLDCRRSLVDELAAARIQHAAGFADEVGLEILDVPPALSAVP